ncbi:hypothetical protein QMY03_02360 [Arthrobacter sp. KFRI-F3372]|nr:hypothetical protein QMY03_02360 [Arthrobacter sp. KFRI-F3372]
MVSFQGADTGCRGDVVELAQQPFPGPGIGAPVLPSGFDEEFAGVGVPGLGDGALVAGWAGGILAGDQPEVGADGRTGEAGPAPDLHGQPERGRNLDAAQTHQRLDHRGVAACRGRGGDLLIDPFELPGEEFGLLDIGLVGELQRRFSKVLAVQPPAVFLRPSCLFGVADAVAQQDGVHVLAGVREVLGRTRAQPGQVPESFFVRVRDPHLGDRADREHLGQHLGIARVGFDPVSGCGQQFRGRRDHTVDAGSPQATGQAKGAVNGNPRML